MVLMRFMGTAARMTMKIKMRMDISTITMAGTMTILRRMRSRIEE